VADVISFAETRSPGADVRPLQTEPLVSSAQGQSVTILGVVTLVISVPSTSLKISAEFLVVDKLVIPKLLGTPWINEHALSINPSTKTVLLSSCSQEEPMEVSLVVERASESTVLSVHAPRVIPAFSVAWVKVRMNR
jgi:hypothetical protein